MTAPALILLAKGSGAERVTQVARQLRKQLQEQRPELNVQLAFLDQCPPSGPQVVTSLANRGTQEMVFVPLDLTRAVEPSDQAQQMLDRVRENHPELRVCISRPIGPAADLLNILDVRLRNALSCCHALELDGLVLSVPNAGDTRGNALMARRTRQWGAHHNLSATVAFSDGSGPNVVAAMSTLRDEGRRHIAVGSFFLTACPLFHHQAELAMGSGALTVSSPFGSDDRILDLVMARYSYAAMDLLDVLLDDDQKQHELSAAN